MNLADNRFRVKWLYVTVFFSGAAVLILEIIGTRIMSPFYGTTIFVWSSLITVTLGAIALGYYIGGRLIDRYPFIKTMSFVVAASSLFLFIPMKIDQWVLPATDSFGLRFGPLVATTILFFLPLFLLGMVGPMAIRLLVKEVSQSGRVAGKVFALSTVGSVAGAMLAGFFLFPHFSITTIFNTVGLVLLVLGGGGIILAGEGFPRINIGLLAALIVIAVSFLAMPKFEHQDNYTFRLHHQEQSRYGDLKVMTVGGSYCLTLNGLTQSCTDTADKGPSFSNVLEMVGVVNKEFLITPKPESFRVLLIGVGAGDMFKVLSSSVTVDAVEIDPQILELAREYFDLHPTTSQKIIIDDGRRFLRQTKETYDFILFDAYAGGYLPPHFLSQEAFRIFAEKLKPGGTLVMNVAARPSTDDRLLISIVRTAQSVFPSVAVTGTSPDNENILRGLILYASRQSGYVSPDSEWYKPVVFSAEEIAHGIIITDAYSPIDFLAADTVSRFRENMKKFGGYKPFFTL